MDKTYLIKLISNNSYNKSHRIGILLFLAIALIILYLPQFYKPDIKKISPTQIEEFNEILNHVDSLQHRWQSLPLTINTLSKDSLIALGMPPKLAQSIEWYKSYGNNINSDEKLMKVRGMTDSIRSMMHVVYDDSSLDARQNGNDHTEPLWKSTEIYINQIDSASLVALGFQPKLAGTITNYRKRIKHFKNKAQLAKVYGLRPNILDQLNINYQKNDNERNKESLTANEAWKSTPIRINQVDSAYLTSIGLSPKVTQKIINNRKRIKGFKNIADLKTTYDLDSDIVDQMRIDYTIPEHPPWTIDRLTTSPDVSGNEAYKTTEIKINKITKDSLIALGIAPQIANTIINYRRIKNGFKNQDEFYKSYGLTDQLKKVLIINYEPADTSMINQDTSYSKYHNFKRIKIHDLNTIDRAQLITLYNIGPYFADLIINERDALGGFYSMQQAYKIRGLRSNGILALKDNTEIRTPQQLIDLSAPAEVIAQHPYITSRQAVKIVDWIKKNPHRPLTDLEGTYIFSDLEWPRVLPYLIRTSD